MGYTRGAPSSQKGREGEMGGRIVGGVTRKVIRSQRPKHHQQNTRDRRRESQGQWIP